MTRHAKKSKDRLTWSFPSYHHQGYKRRKIFREDADRVNFLDRLSVGSGTLVKNKLN